MTDLAEATLESDESDQHFERVVDDLAAAFSDIYDRQTVAQAVAQARLELETDARVTRYLPVLAFKRARQRLMVL